MGVRRYAIDLTGKFVPALVAAPRREREQARSDLP
jgi:hypothetical protein